MQHLPSTPLDPFHASTSSTASPPQTDPAGQATGRNPSPAPEAAARPAGRSSPHNDPVALYQVRRVWGGSVIALVVHVSGFATPLPHQVHHSPDGYELGYGGSGPADLARSIIGHYLNDPNPSPALYQDFKLRFLASPTVRDGIDITVGAITAWMDRRRAQELSDRARRERGA